jgi:hypothetical protein
VGWAGRECDVFAQDCGAGEGCYLLLQPYDGYPTYCFVAVPEPDIQHDGCVEEERPIPQQQGECCSYINTCDIGLGCIQPNPVDDGLVCATFCDPTGTVGTNDCFSSLGPNFWCLAIRDFYVGGQDLDYYFGFCVDDTIWGPPECFNGVQDPDEDGIDCCNQGNPTCPCFFQCG